MITKQAALVFDCGTNETKAIFLKYDDGDIIVEETGKVPAVLTFLGSPKPTLLRETAEWRKKIVKAKKRGEPEPKLCKYFLKDSPPVDDDYVLTLQDFLAFVQCKRLEHDEEVNTVMVGSSAWLRSADEYNVTKQADTLVKELQSIKTVCQNLDQSAEGMYEAISVAYAVCKTDASMEINGVLGSGGGSVQFFHRFGICCRQHALIQTVITATTTSVATTTPNTSTNITITTTTTTTSSSSSLSPP